MLFLFIDFFSIASLALIYGSGIYTLFSNLLLTAESIAQGRLVAPSTNTSLHSWPTPCICIKNYVFTLLDT